MKNLKWILCFVCFLSLGLTLHSQSDASNYIDDELFKKSLLKIMNAAQQDKFTSMKGEVLESEYKSNVKVTKWKSLDSLPGQMDGFIIQSFGVSYRCTFAESKTVSSEFLRRYYQIKFLLEQSLSRVNWQHREDVKDDGNLRLTISSLIKADTFVKPNILLEIVNKNGNYKVQLSVTI